MITSGELAAYADKSDDELYELLGAMLLGPGLPFAAEEADSNRRFGRRWFQQRRRALQDLICGHPLARTVTGNNVADNIIDAAAILELLHQANVAPVDTALLAVLVARIGLGTFCADAAPPEP